MVCVICGDICDNTRTFIIIRSKSICEDCAYAILGKMMRREYEG